MINSFVVPVTEHIPHTVVMLHTAGHANLNPSLSSTVSHTHLKPNGRHTPPHSPPQHVTSFKEHPPPHPETIATGRHGLHVLMSVGAYCSSFHTSIILLLYIYIYNICSDNTALCVAGLHCAADRDLMILRARF